MSQSPLGRTRSRHFISSSGVPGPNGIHSHEQRDRGRRVVLGRRDSLPQTWYDDGWFCRNRLARPPNGRRLFEKSAGVPTRTHGGENGDSRAKRRFAVSRLDQVGPPAIRIRAR
jgi:hypothetical protein